MARFKPLVALRAARGSGLSTKARRVWTELCLAANRDGEAYPKLATLQEWCGLARSSVITGLAELRERGAVRLKERQKRTKVQVWSLHPLALAPERQQALFPDDQGPGDGPSSERPRSGRRTIKVRETDHQGPGDGPSPTTTDPLNDPLTDRGRGIAPESGDATSPFPAWARRKSFRKRDGTEQERVEHVVACIQAITQRPVQLERSEVAAVKVLSLWRRVGRPPLAEFRAELVLVAEAAHDCPERLFARDIRAEGWQDGVDRQFQVGTICRQDRWDDRLRAARRWHERGRPKFAGRHAGRHHIGDQDYGESSYDF